MLRNNKERGRLKFVQSKQVVEVVNVAEHRQLWNQKHVFFSEYDNK